MDAVKFCPYCASNLEDSRCNNKLCVHYGYTVAGPTGKYPEGKLSGEDEGELVIRIGRQEGNIVLDFGKATTWLALPREEARQIAHGILQAYDEYMPRDPEIEKACNVLMEAMAGAAIAYGRMIGSTQEATAMMCFLESGKAYMEAVKKSRIARGLSVDPPEDFVLAPKS